MVVDTVEVDRPKQDQVTSVKRKSYQNRYHIKREMDWWPVTVRFFVITNIAIWVVLLFFLIGHRFVGERIIPYIHNWSVTFEVRLDTLKSPEKYWKFFTYSVVHDSHQWGQLIIEMFGLWFFGSLVARKYGEKLLFTSVLLSVPLCGLFWVLLHIPLSMTNSIGTYSGMLGTVVMLAMLTAFVYPKLSLAAILATSGIVILLFTGPHADTAISFLLRYTPWWGNAEMILSGMILSVPMFGLMCFFRDKRYSLLR